MDPASSPSWLERQLVPRALFVGVAVAFIACCAAGHFAASRNTLTGFTRFHLFLTPESLHYPTVRQVRQLARDTLDPAKVVVIVGGSSIMQGTGQPAGQVWTDRLQALLGDDFQVLNLGFQGAFTNEFGAVAAEVLGADFPRLILIADITPGCLPPADGWAHRHFFWDARTRGLLLSDPARERGIREHLENIAQHERRIGHKKTLENYKTTPEHMNELRLAMHLDRYLAFRDLWNTVNYTAFSTVWTKYTRKDFAEARAVFADPEPQPRPLGERYHPSFDAAALEHLRRLLLSHPTVETPPSADDAEQDGSRWAQSLRALESYFPPAVRGRTLLPIMWGSPHYVNQLDAGERRHYAEMMSRHVAVCETLGLSGIEISRGHEALDYSDARHLTAAGGARMAADLAPRVRSIAERLGYVKGGE